MNYYGLTIASFVTIVIPIWMIGWKIISLSQKLLFSVVGLSVVWYAVEYGGFRRKG